MRADRSKNGESSEKRPQSLDGMGRLQGGRPMGGKDDVARCRKRVSMATGEEGARHREASSR